MKIWTVLFLFSVSSLMAETNAPPRRGPPTGWSPFVKGGALHNFGTELDGGGDFSVNRSYIEGGWAYLFRPDRMVSVSVGYGRDDYRFSGLAADPWGSVESYRLSVFTRWGLDESWSVFLIPSLRSYGETGISMEDALSGAVFGGISYRFGERLTLGPGLGVVGQIEDNPRYFPVFIIDWKITDRLSLGTGGGLAATSGPGLALDYEASRKWKLGLSGRYETRRFRLDDEGLTPNGVGEDEYVTVIGSIIYSLNPSMRFGAYSGLDIGGELDTEDSNGNNIASVDYNSSALTGLVFDMRF